MLILLKRSAERFTYSQAQLNFQIINSFISCQLLCNYFLQTAYTDVIFIQITDKQIAIDKNKCTIKGINCRIKLIAQLDMTALE